MPKARDDWSAYMRDYRRRRRLNNHQPLGTRQDVISGSKVHDLCDRRIAELEAEVAQLRERLSNALEF